ncbi:MAG TPA: hypothetical protein VHX14_03830 [Thermoanaerobaculia bacterium]|jgi:hypothetical protein|nr:hypothetical protein [Thermoanaerobaculia bacterium]
MRLGVITLGHVHEGELAALTPHLEHLEQLVLDVPFTDPLAKHRAELNRAVDAASDDWLLIVREREVIDEAIAAEIAAAMRAQTAWGFRIRSVPMYAGKPLRIGVDEGELRLFHRRHLLRRGDLGVQGTVVRLNNVLRSITFESAEAHRDYLAKNGVPHSLLRRLLLFAHHALVTRAHDANTLRYLWIEAGYDHGAQAKSESA